MTLRRLTPSLVAAALACTSLGCSAGAGTPPASPQSPALTASHALPTSDRAADLCAGLPEPEQEHPSFLREAWIEDVRPVVAERSQIKFRSELRGAEIVLRPDPTVTRHWVTRVLRCHLADPIGLAMRASFDDPLVVGTPTVSLAQTSDRIVLRIAGRDGAQGEEILRRAERLRSGDTRD
jgi:hypothetical protein